MDSKYKLISGLLSEINQLLDNDTEYLLPLLNKAARLASLCGDIEHRVLFETHIEGIDLSKSSGDRIQKWSENREPRWDIINAFYSDRRMSNGKVQIQSLQQLEYIKKGIESAGNNVKTELLETEFDMATITGRIRNRVGRFIRITETELLDEQQEENEELRRKPSTLGEKVFIGHGRSLLWKNLKDFISERLHLPYEEFNREPTAGKSIKDRLEEMLNESSFAFLIMTAEDEHGDKTFHARENVIHEIGLFQGRLGFSKAIVLLEEGCEEFSNIHGLTQIRFPKEDILAKSEELRRVLEREGVLTTNSKS